MHCSSVAFPAYLNYVRVSKETASIANCVAAERLIKAELSKKSGGAQASDDIIRDLNLGGKKSPFKSSIPAFMTSMDMGVGRISGQNLDAAIVGYVCWQNTAEDGAAWTDLRWALCKFKIISQLAKSTVMKKLQPN